MTRRTLLLGLVAVAALAVAAESYIALRAAAGTLAILKLPREKVVLEALPEGALALEPVTFRSEDGLLLRGSFVASRNGATIVLTHGIGGSRRQVWGEAKALVRRGYGILAFDFRAHGESEGEGSTFGEVEVRDLRAALAFLERRGIARVGALGFSMGAMVVANVASSDPRISAVVLEGASPSIEYIARYNARRWGLLSELPAVWASQLHGLHLDRNRPVDHLCAIAPRPLLFIFGDDEVVAGWEPEQQMMQAACEPKQLWVMKHTGHGGYTSSAPGEVEERLATFFDGALRVRAVGLLPR